MLSRYRTEGLPAFRLLPLLFPFVMEKDVKTPKKIISTNKRRAKHPFAGWNTTCLMNIGNWVLWENVISALRFWRSNQESSKLGFRITLLLNWPWRPSSLRRYVISLNWYIACLRSQVWIAAWDYDFDRSEVEILCHYSNSRAPGDMCRLGYQTERDTIYTPIVVTPVLVS